MGCELAAVNNNTSVKAICKKIGINYSYFSQLKTKEKPEIKGSLLSALCQHYKISPIWLLLGIGQPDENHEEVMKYIKRMDKFMDRVLVPMIEGYFKNEKKDVRELLKNISRS